jgi:peptidoglycan-associated lipoprotein
MKSGIIRTVFSVVTVAALVLGSAGCKKKNGANGQGLGSDILDPMNQLGGGQIGLAERGEFGIPVTDANAKFNNVSFAYDSFTIADSERSKIEAVADFMVANTDTTVVVDGHCDERGSREYNLSLGEHRALAIRAYLISLGIAGDRIHTRSFGQEQPLDPGHDEAAWLANRRGEFSLFRQ